MLASAFKLPATTRKKIHLNDSIEEVTNTTQKVPVAARAAIKSAPSLRPGIAMMEASAAGNPEATSIRDAWAFRFPVRIVGRDEYEAMVERNRVVFHG